MGTHDVFATRTPLQRICAIHRYPARVHAARRRRAHRPRHGAYASLGRAARAPKPSEGAYLAYPLDDLLRLTALESHQNRAVVIGEDLGTVPTGFRERLVSVGIYGMNVLWFERKQAGFTVPQSWPTEVAAMTSTHDLPTVAGWWRGRDIEVRGQLGFVADQEREQAAPGR